MAFHRITDAPNQFPCGILAFIGAFQHIFRKKAAWQIARCIRQCISQKLALSQMAYQKELLLPLSKYCRISTKQGEQFVPLSKELEHIDIYLQLKKARYEGKLMPEYHIEEDLQQDMPILRFILHPIVENAVRHGVSPDADIAEATSGNEAINAIARELFDILFIDINLGDMMGTAVASVARTLQPFGRIFLFPHP